MTKVKKKLVSSNFLEKDIIFILKFISNLSSVVYQIIMLMNKLFKPLFQERKKNKIS